jgi:hypothetical protein
MTKLSKSAFKIFPEIKRKKERRKKTMAEGKAHSTYSTSKKTLIKE